MRDIIQISQYRQTGAQATNAAKTTLAVGPGARLLKIPVEGGSLQISVDGRISDDNNSVLKVDLQRSQDPSGTKLTGKYLSFDLVPTDPTKETILFNRLINPMRAEDNSVGITKEVPSGEYKVQNIRLETAAAINAARQNDKGSKVGEFLARKVA